MRRAGCSPACPMSERHISADTVVALERQYRFQWEPAQNAHVLLYPEGMIKLSGSAAEIMQRIDGKTSAEGIIANLQQSFPGVDLRQDVLDFLEDIHGRGWIRASPEQ
jgi:pyrroloquinoline quinone biosynthesis protein D